MAAVAAAVLVAAIAGGIGIALLARDDGDESARRPPVGSAPPQDGAPSPTIPPRRSAPPTAPSGVEFDDPDGTYTMTIGAEWAAMSGALARGIETWAIGDATREFQPNVNVLTQDAPGMDLDDYLEVSVRGMRGLDLELSDHATVTTAEGELGMMVYSGPVPGVAADLSFLAVFGVRDGTAVVATLSAPPDRFDTLRAAVEPYLLTLHVVG